LQADGSGALECCPYPAKRVRDHRVVCHDRTSSLACRRGSTTVRGSDAWWVARVTGALPAWKPWTRRSPCRLTCGSR
jgi:hypothetical protein